MKKVSLLALLLALILCLSVAGAAAEGFPTKGITLIVPWNPGGVSDLIGRMLCAEMEQTLGVKISVVNTPGATGTVGMNDCMLAPHDGYTLIANAPPYHHCVLELADWVPSDWDFFNAYDVPNVIAVRKDSPYQTFEDLYNAIKENPGKITGGTAGEGSSGYTCMAILESVDPTIGNYKMIAYTGGAPAVTACLAGEVDFTPQLCIEEIDLLRSGDLIALAATTAEDLVLDGVDYTIPSIKNFIPEAEAVLPIADAFGLLFPSDVPQENKDVLEAAYLEACKSDAAITFGQEKGIMLVGRTLAESRVVFDTTASRVDWILYDAGIAKRSPEEFNIPRP